MGSNEVTAGRGYEGHSPSHGWELDSFSGIRSGCKRSATQRKNKDFTIS